MYAVQAPKAIHKLGKQSLISFLSIFFWRKSLLPFIICTKPLCCGLCKTFHLQHGSFYSPCCMPPSLAVERAAGDRALRCIDLVIHVIFAKAYGFQLCFFLRLVEIFFSMSCKDLLQCICYRSHFCSFLLFCSGMFYHSKGCKLACIFAIHVETIFKILFQASMRSFEALDLFFDKGAKASLRAKIAECLSA